MPRLRDLLRGDTVDKLTEESLQREALDRIAPNYALLFFDHLYSEYLALKPSITDPEITKRLEAQRLEALHEKRLKCELTWSDIYSFELTLVHARPLENLIRKAYEARAKYRSIAGQKEYDEYVASKPPNLPEIRIDPKANPPQPELFIERALRADLEYLLSKVYLYYAILPVRERLRDWLTNRAVVITLGAVVVIGVLIFINVLLNLIVTTEFKSAVPNVKPETGYTFGQMLVVVITVFSEMSVVLVTLLTVGLAGIVGGCVSMLQRIQSAPSEGDTLFNLAALTNGWKGIFLSPLYGGIFAALLFVLFAAGLLEGSAFPRINTPRRQFNLQTATLPTATPSPAPSPSASASPSPPASASPLTSPSPAASPALRAGAPTASPTPSPAASPTTAATADTQASNTQAGNASANQRGSERQAPPSPSPTPSPVAAVQRLPVLEIKEFLKFTGPADGTSYALLIIWSFIAGFAERLVPDTLNRLVTKNEAIQGTNT